MHGDRPEVSGEEIDHRLLLLDPRDNVFVARVPLRGGDDVIIDGASVAVARDVAVGFKIARRRIALGGEVIKYGAIIGVTTRDVDAGERVHTDNMKSNYIAPHLNPDGS